MNISFKENGLKVFSIDKLLSNDKRIVLNYWPIDVTDMVLKHWDEANSIDEFKKSILADDSLSHCQGYAILSREDMQEHWYRIRRMFGDKCFKTDSDAGGVRVGNEEFNLVIPNGHGDGTTRVAVFRKGDKFNLNMMNYYNVLHGKFNIYDYDCSCDRIIETLEGDFSTYYYEGLVAFVE